MPAAIGAGLFAVLQLVNGVLFAGVVAGDAALVIASTAVPSAAWCVFFAILPRAPRTAAIAALTFAVLPRAAYLVAAPSLVPALLTVCWAAFLIVLARGQGSRWLARLALPLLILTALQCLGDLLTVLSSITELVTGSIILFFRYNPLRTVWRQLLTPAILTFYWVAQVRFLLAVRDES